MGFNKTMWDEMNEFADYIHSPKWKKLKQERLKKDNGCCVICKSKEKLVCHHMTYFNLYDENINDLITLCFKCHNKVHRVSPPKNQPEFTKGSALDNIFKPTEKEMIELIKKLNDL